MCFNYQLASPSASFFIQFFHFSGEGSAELVLPMMVLPSKAKDI